MSAKHVLPAVLFAYAALASPGYADTPQSGGTLGGTLKELFAHGKPAPQASVRAINGAAPAAAAAAHCRDGSFSDNPANHGSCAHHGGVMTKL